MNSERTTCCIVGGGPAGIFLGYLLARTGVSVVVLEKHEDFLRDFRGDTIHPSTFDLLDELGLLEEFLPLTDFQAQQLWVNFEGRRIAGPSLAHLDATCRSLGFTPQWDFLNFISQEADRYEHFDLRMNTRGTQVIRENGLVVGVCCESDGVEYEIRTDLVVAADGRKSTLRAESKWQVQDTGVPIDALWFRLDRPAHDEQPTLGWLRHGHMLVTIPRREHYQIAMVIRKGGFAQIKAQGLDAFREAIASVCPVLQDVVHTLRDWEEIKLLTVQINHLEQWYEPGLLFIGDAAHAMSPMGGVGINLAIQDAVAAANQLARPLLNGTASTDDLKAVQDRRSPPTRKTQQLQARAHALLFGDSRQPDEAFSIPWYLRLGIRLFAPLLRRYAGRVIGQGFQPEHIKTVDMDNKQLLL